MKMKNTETTEVCSFCGCCIGGDYIEYELFEADPIKQCRACTDSLKAFLYGVSAKKKTIK